MAPSCDGRACLHLDELLDGTAQCRIYAQRPPICRVDENKPEGEAWIDFYKRVAQRCNELQEAEGIPESFRVRL